MKEAKRRGRSKKALGATEEKSCKRGSLHPLTRPQTDAALVCPGEAEPRRNTQVDIIHSLVTSAYFAEEDRRCFLLREIRYRHGSVTGDRKDRTRRENNRPRVALLFFSTLSISSSSISLYLRLSLSLYTSTPHFCLPPQLTLSASVSLSLCLSTSLSSSASSRPLIVSEARTSLAAFSFFHLLLTVGCFCPFPLLFFSPWTLGDPSEMQREDEVFGAAESAARDSECPSPSRVRKGLSLCSFFPTHGPAQAPDV